MWLHSPSLPPNPDLWVHLGSSPHPRRGTSFSRDALRLACAAVPSPDRPHSARLLPLMCWRAMLNPASRRGQHSRDPKACDQLPRNVAHASPEANIPALTATHRHAQSARVWRRPVGKVAARRQSLTVPSYVKETSRSQKIADRFAASEPASSALMSVHERRRIDKEPRVPHHLLTKNPRLVQA